MYKRTAGNEDAYAEKYHDSIREAGESGLIWNETDFVAYVADPKKFLASFLDDSKARSSMSFKLKKEADAKAIWAYLVSVGPEVGAD